MTYTEQEQIKLNEQLKRWQKRQLTAVRQNNIDKAFESMSEIDRAIWEQVARAESYKEVNVLVWSMADRVIDKYCKLAR
jgi:ribosome biogenesis protein Nip4